jgi:dihydrofolate synthase/folylpolyglutamate synthase
MTDKDVEGMLSVLEPHLAHIVCTQNSTARAMPARDLAAVAAEVFGSDRVTVEPRLDDAIDRATAIAESGDSGSSIGSGAVVVTGSVITVGEARSMLRRRGSGS